MWSMVGRASSVFSVSRISLNTSHSASKADRDGTESPCEASRFVGYGAIGCEDEMFCFPEVENVFWFVKESDFFEE